MLLTTARLTDVRNVTLDRKVALVLDHLPFVPRAGDEVYLDEAKKVIEAVGNHMTRDCATALPLPGMGMAYVLVEGEEDEFRKLMRGGYPFEVILRQCRNV